MKSLPPQRIAVTGSSGLIGTSLIGHLKSEGHTVQRLVRRKAVASDEVQWDPGQGFVDVEPLRGVDAVIHLAGAGVGDAEGRCNEKNGTRSEGFQTEHRSRLGAGTT